MVESGDHPLMGFFVPHLHEGWQQHAERAGDLLEEALQRLVERTGSPEIIADSTEFLPHVACRLPTPSHGADDGDLLRTLDRLRGEDMALAWACSRGDTEAVSELERRHFHVVRAALGQIPDAAAQAEEVTQLLRQRLFVPPSKERPPRIAQYGGRGDLRSWLRVAAIRCAINYLQKQGREVAMGDEQLGRLADPEQDQELGLLKRRYRAEFKRAFESALRSLISRDRNLLRYHYLERLSIDQIGAIHGVHRTTVARWLARTRKSLLADTRKSLMAQLQIGRPEFESIMRLIESQLDASIARFLDTIPPDSDET